MPLKRPVKLVTSSGGQTQIKRGRPTGGNDQELKPVDLSQEVPEIIDTLNRITRVLNGHTEETRRGCGCGG